MDQFGRGRTSRAQVFVLALCLTLLAVFGATSANADSDDLVVSSTELFFPDTVVNSFSPYQHPTLTNQSQSPIQLGQATTTGSYILGATIGGCFQSVGGGSGSGILLGAGQSCELWIQAYPQQVGSNDGIFSFTSNGQPSPITIALHNTGLPSLVLASTELFFPDTVVNSFSPYQHPTLTNQSQSPIQLGQATTTGSYILGATIGGCFQSVGGGSGSGILLGAGQSCELWIQAYPQQVGSNDGIFSFTSNGQPSPITMALHNTGLPGSELAIADAQVSEGNTGQANATFAVSLSNPSQQTVTVNYATSDGTATAGQDYVATSGTLTFAPGETAATITVKVNGDNFNERDEVFFVNLTDPTNAIVTKAQGLGTIANDDFPSISINDVSVIEGDSGTAKAIFTVSLSSPSQSIVSVDFTTMSASAQAGSDYAFNSGTVSFVPGVTTQMITVLVNGDTWNEPDEIFTVFLSNAGGATISDGQGIATIMNDDPLPTISFDDVVISEGAGFATFTVSLSAPSGQTVLVNFTTEDGSAKAGSDYLPVSGTLVFAEGTTVQTIRVAIVNDDLNEADENFFVTLSNPTNAVFAIARRLGDINDDDRIDLAIDDQSVSEPDSGQSSSMTFMVTLSGPSEQIVTVDYTTVDGPAKGGAVSGSDYIINAGTLIFPPGVASQTIVVIVNGDNIDEDSETFFVNLSKPTNGIITRGTGIGTIDDNDGAPTISINDVTVTEGNTGTVDATFTVSLSNPSQSTVTVDFATADGTAQTSSDYVANSGTLIFAPGLTSQTITVFVKGDIFNEPDEIFGVALTNATLATIGDPQGVGTIANDDAPPMLMALDVSASEGTSLPGTAIVEVRLSAPSGQIVIVNFVTMDGTAKDGNGEPTADYVATTGTLVFNPGETMQTINVSLENDTVDEEDETFFVDLRTPTNATIDKGRAVVTILDDDVATPAVQLAELARQVGSFDLPQGRENSLLAKLRLECGPLGAFENEVEAHTSKDLTPLQAGRLLQGAAQLLIDLGCAQVLPTIASFTPASGVVGTVVTINGTNLATVSEVTFNGTAASPITVVSATSIKVNVPIGATTGKISVTNSAGTAMSAGVFKVLPKIDSFAPASGVAGTAVRITGLNFTTTPTVRFGSVIAPVLSATDTSIVATVPATAITGKISVTTADGSSLSATDFIVIRPPTISSFTPALGMVGALVTINGADLSSATDVRFGGVSAGSPIVISSTSISATVPAGAVTGPISVTNPAGTATSATSFTVLP